MEYICRLSLWPDYECIKPLSEKSASKAVSIEHTNTLFSSVNMLSTKCTQAYKSGDSVHFIRPREWFPLPEAWRFAPATTKYISWLRFRDNVVDWWRTNGRQLGRRECHGREIGDH